MTAEVRVVDPTTGGEKGSKQERFDLVPVRALTELARLYGKGAEKYDERNWEKGYKWSLSYAALMRHVTQFWGGEDLDAESQLPHLAAVMFHAAAMIEFMETHRELDDRPSKKTAKKITPMYHAWEDAGRNSAGISCSHCTRCGMTTSTVRSSTLFGCI